MFTLFSVKASRYIREAAGEKKRRKKKEAAVRARPMKSNRSKGQQTGVQDILPQYNQTSVQLLYPSSIQHWTTYTEAKNGPHFASINVTAWTDERLVEHYVFNRRLEEWTR